MARDSKNRRLQPIIDECRRQGVPLRFERRDGAGPAGPGRRAPGSRGRGRPQGLREPGGSAGSLDHPGLLVILDGVEDPHNLGAIIRSAHAAGADALLLPERRSAGLTETVQGRRGGARIPAGGARLEHQPDARRAETGRTTGSTASTSAATAGLRCPRTIPATWRWCSGGEGKGLHELTAKRCDFLVKIPVAGRIASLNVSVAAGIVLIRGPAAKARPRQYHGSARTELAAVSPRAERGAASFGLVRRTRPAILDTYRKVARPGSAPAQAEDAPARHGELFGACGVFIPLGQAGSPAARIATMKHSRHAVGAAANPKRHAQLNWFASIPNAAIATRSTRRFTSVPPAKACWKLRTTSRAAQPTELKEIWDRRRLSRDPLDTSGVWRFREMLPFADDPAQIVTCAKATRRCLDLRPRRCLWRPRRLQFKHQGYNPTGVVQRQRHDRRRHPGAQAGDEARGLRLDRQHLSLDGRLRRRRRAAGDHFHPARQHRLRQARPGARIWRADNPGRGEFRPDSRAGAPNSPTKLGIYLLNSINPFRIEGQKSIAIEMLDQRDWRVPDWIVLPGGNLGQRFRAGKGRPRNESRSA